MLKPLKIWKNGRKEKMSSIQTCLGILSIHLMLMLSCDSPSTEVEIIVPKYQKDTIVKIPIQIPPFEKNDSSIAVDSILIKRYKNYSFKAKKTSPLNAYQKQLTQKLIDAKTPKEYTNQPPLADTMMDVNGDGYLDLILEYYGLMGTGDKYFHDIYLYHPQKGKYIDSVSLMNPSYYPEKGEITAIYIPHGGASGAKYRWYNYRLDTIEIFLDQMNSIGDSLFSHSYLENRLKGKVTLRTYYRGRFIPKEYQNYLHFSKNMLPDF
jgi:hypothetical protein